MNESIYPGSLSHQMDYPSMHSLACRLTLKKLNEEGVFWGYASTHDVDRSGDQILPGAFTKTLANWKQQRGRFPHLYWEHDLEEVIGLCQELKEDKNGLYIKGKLLVEIPQARYVYHLLQEGLDGLSIGFFTVRSEYTAGIRKISEVDLREVSLVSNPCNQEALIYEYKTTHEMTLALHRLKQALILPSN